MHCCILLGMQSTSVRIDVETHERLKALAAELGATVGETVAVAVRHLRQERIGADLVGSQTQQDTDWLDADLR